MWRPEPDVDCVRVLEVAEVVAACHLLAFYSMQLVGVRCTLPPSDRAHCAGLIPSVWGMHLVAADREAGVFRSAVEVSHSALPPTAALHNGGRLE